MEEKIIDILKEVIGDKSIRIDENTDLIDNGILDSLAFIELFAMLEEEFFVEVQPTQINPESWRTVSSIKELVLNLLSMQKWNSSTFIESK